MVKNWKAKNPEEWKKNLSLSHKGPRPWAVGRHHTKKTKLKISISKKGTKLTQATKRKISKSLKGKPKPFGFNMGHKVSEETRKKISESNKGKKRGVAWNKGLKNSVSHRKNISNALTGRKLSPEHIKKCLKRNPKSSLEIKFEEIIKELGMPYKFVGNGEVLIARKCPDFVDSNGKKVAIEVYYRRHKEQFRGGLAVWKAERAKIFTEEGWKIIFFDETQVNKETVKSVLGK